MDSVLMTPVSLVGGNAPVAAPPLAGLPWGAAAGRCASCGLGGPVSTPGLGLAGSLPTTLMLEQLLGLLAGMLTGEQLRRATGLTSGSGTARAVEGASATSDSQAPPSGTPLAPGSKVLMIGDSHSVGTFGQQLDRQLRAAGAQVESYAASGSSANSWLNGGTTKSGWVARHQGGGVEQPPWNQPHAIPKLADLIAQHRPEVVIINLGANFRSDPSQARKLAEVCKRAGTRVIWVGPPRTREDDADGGARLRAFDEGMKQALAGVGEYLSSAHHTPRYAGGDGLHYNGAEGSRIASQWARGIARQITGG